MAAVTGALDLPRPRVCWTQPETEWVKMGFRRIRRDVRAGRLGKMVPVATASGQLLEGAWQRLVEPVLAAPEGFWCYGRVQDEAGFLGATPELLFRSDGGEVTTMALAGTAKPGHDVEFLEDLKEIEEHELVVAYLMERLEQLGQVEKSARGTLAAGGLTHFQTHVRLSMDYPADPTSLVPWLHPTPAVGCLPRTEEWLAVLREYRARLRAPGFFGAPFGFIQGGICHMVVAIRGLGWQGAEGMLPSGCGIVGGSAFDHEWRELQIKRQAVLEMLNLDGGA